MVLCRTVCIDLVGGHCVDYHDIYIKTAEVVAFSFGEWRTWIMGRGVISALFVSNQQEWKCISPNYVL